jgi:hypothetical protein
MLDVFLGLSSCEFQSLPEFNKITIRLFLRTNLSNSYGKSRPHHRCQQRYGTRLRDLVDGAKGIVWAATLCKDGPSGGFFRDGQPLGW